VGVELVEDVLPYEEAKIRLLNATHSCIAWAGTLAGYSYIHEGTLDSEIRQFAFDYVTEDVLPCLQPCPLNLEEYRDVVLDRFSNPNIKDTNARVAMDGYSKVPGFILPTIRDRLDRNESINAVALLPALFLEFLRRERLGEVPYQYQDQLMEPGTAEAILNAVDPVSAFCSDRLLFNDLAGDERIVAAVRAAYVRAQTFAERRKAA